MALFEGSLFLAGRGGGVVEGGGYDQDLFGRGFEGLIERGVVLKTVFGL